MHRWWNRRRDGRQIYSSVLTVGTPVSHTCSLMSVWRATTRRHCQSQPQCSNCPHGPRLRLLLSGSVIRIREDNKITQHPSPAGVERWQRIAKPAQLASARLRTTVCLALVGRMAIKLHRLLTMRLTSAHISPSRPADALLAAFLSRCAQISRSHAQRPRSAPRGGSRDEPLQRVPRRTSTLCAPLPHMNVMVAADDA
ncbi:hypothetical protein ACVIHF_000707 [Bradyrhizobium sp. USDA 4506]